MKITISPEACKQNKKKHVIINLERKPGTLIIQRYHRLKQTIITIIQF